MSENWLLVLIGPSGAIAIIVGASTGAGAFVDSIINDSAKRKLAHFLLREDAAKLEAFLSVSLSVFKRAFGHKHFSLRCISQSIRFTLLASLTLFVAMYFHSTAWREAFNWLFSPHPLDDSPLATEQAIAVLEFITARTAFWMFAAAFIIDYVALAKSRFLLRWITRKNAGPSIALLIAVGDLVLTFFIFCLIFTVVLFVVWDRLAETYFGVGVDLTKYAATNVLPVFSGILHDFFQFFFAPPSTLGGRITTLELLAAFLPSAWISVWAISAIIIRVAISVAPKLRTLMYFLKTETHPGRTVGAMSGLIFVLFYLLAGLFTWWVK